ncbi:MAG: DUF1501 domain-containing protein [Rhodospirillales bacterium]|nr:DUF1501 domain-containing protein [Rhodospirillales bacterium]MDE2199188.1 DUF1501 domain-containing protein [Rhodospirillales bacterium]MDE2577008.1 DUF1501 domain-containing protein [Rhodospirillales bacterium]
MRLTRRTALLGLAGAVTVGRASLALAAAPTERRFVVVILRGALDGMSAVVPYGDPALAGLRGELVGKPAGQPGGLLDLGGFYGLHPELVGLHGLYAAGEFLPVHAVAGHYRVRSHFEAQDYMESGADQRLDSGWLNRVAALIPARGPGEPALSVGAQVPLLLRGPTPVGSWLPPSYHSPAPDLYARIAALNSQDSVLGPAIVHGLRERGFTEAVLAGTAEPPNKYAFSALAGTAGKLLGAADGPRLAALEIGGWDTHVAQLGQLAYPLRQLDAGLVALKSGMGAAWRQTVVLVMTEFGRTVRVNGTHGTDHGTGTVAFVLGGAVAGGKVRADWPGLGAGKLFENRDLQPTADLRSVAKGVLAAHLGIDASGLARIFPGSGQAAPMGGLLRA